jgi:hypothetical protein
VRKCAEAMASEFDRDDQPKERTLSFAQSQRLLLHLLPLADRAQGIDRPFLEAVRARREHLRIEQRVARTKRRAELISLYSAMLRLGLPLHESDLCGDGQQLSARDRRIQRQVVEHLREEGRPRQASTSTNTNRFNAALWNPPAEPAPVRHIVIQSAPLFTITTKNKTISSTCAEVPTLTVPKRLRASFEHAPQI